MCIELPLDLRKAVRHFDKVEKIRGLDITIVTHGTNKNHTLALLEEFNFPFNKEKKIEF